MKIRERHEYLCDATVGGECDCKYGRRKSGDSCGNQAPDGGPDPRNVAHRARSLGEHSRESNRSRPPFTLLMGTQFEKWLDGQDDLICLISGGEQPAWRLAEAAWNEALERAAQLMKDRNVSASDFYATEIRKLRG